MASEKWLIDANEAIANTYEEVYCTESEQAWLRHFIIKQQTVDAVEVVHGRWEKHPKDTYARENHCDKLRCTRCWHFFYHAYGDGKHYCPNCGAKMDGDGNG